ncbi:TIGR02253 family HAD-type hydrolase [Palaeococcus ferrophilus]|uniref:TIGR02253 family HAD-type hydrolase n=1 Tax=Palaeococcus ferrophilus TaxID=83868 RepID=UPI00064FD304|nr:TIGR02253 family HAD-type hydrolase [Palaeococcus ferrophilus]
MIKAVFFDFVGTLITKRGEEVTHQNIVREVLRKAGREDLDVVEVWKAYEDASSRAFKALAGKPFKPVRIIDTEAMGEVGKEYGFEVPADFWEIHLRMHALHGELVEGTKEVLKGLRERGIHVGLVTDSDNDYLKAHLEALGLLEYFDSITTSEEAGFYKPHPAVFQLALKKAGVEGDETIYVGDNPSKDCVGARSVDMSSVLYDPEGSKRELWNECEFIISDLREVLKIVEEL